MGKKRTIIKSQVKTGKKFCVNKKVILKLVMGMLIFLMTFTMLHLSLENIQCIKIL